MDRVWTRCRRSPMFVTKLVDKSVSAARARPAIVGLARRGPRPKAVSRMQISGVDYGPAVPSGVSVCPARSHGSHARDDHAPRARRRGDPRRPRPRSTRSSRDSPAVRPRGPVARASACRSSSRSRRSTRSARSRAAARGSPSHALAGEGRIGPDRPIVCVSAGNFGQGVAYAARALGIPAVVFASRNANRGKVAADARARRGGHRGGRGLRRRPRARPRRTPPSTRSSCSSTATIRASRPAPRRWRSS